MAAGSFSIIAAIMMMLSGNSGDLLDRISTDAYWQAKGGNRTVEQLLAEIAPPAPAGDVAPLIKTLGSGTFAEREAAAQKIEAMGPSVIPALQKSAEHPDLEVANRARSLILKIQTASKASQVRRLMAIRTLGELKKPEAAPALRGLLQSREMFVAQYAARALAGIEGKELPPANGAAMSAKELALLPGNIGIVGQMRFELGKAETVDKMMAALPPMMMGPNQDPRQMAAQITGEMIKLVDQIGNVRVDSISVGVAEDVGPNAGFVVLVIRGQYDAGAVEAMLGKVEDIVSRDVDGVRMWGPKHDTEFGWFLPSNEHLVAVGGPRQAKMPVKEVADAVAAGQHAKGISTNKELTRLMATIDTSAPLWAVARINDNMRKEEKLFAAFDYFTMTSKLQKGGMDFEVKGQGTDAAKVADAVKTVNDGLDEARKNIPQMLQMMPGLKPMADFMQTIKCNGDGAAAKLTARMEGNMGSMMMFPFMAFGMHAGAAAPQPQVAEPAPAVRVDPAQPEKEVKPQK